MATPRAYQPAYFLRQQGFKKSGDKYINPLTGRKITKQSALDKAAKVLGWRNFDTYKRAFTVISKGQSNTAYERFKQFAEQRNRATGLGTKFDLLFKAAYNTNPPFKSRSKQLKELLTYVGKRNKNTRFAAGESPRARRVYKSGKQSTKRRLK